MCGIAVTFGFNGRPAERAIVSRMTTSLVHRGPDDEGIYVDGSVGLGFRRLAILDLSAAAHQPMVSQDGNFVLVFNGEIFNYLELKDELRQLGHEFRSTGDSEVLLHAYQEWGPKCLPKLNGMWAFVIYDRRRQCLFGSRDRFGVKPLYVYKTTDLIVLASEIKAIRASGLHRTELNWKTTARFLLEEQLDTTSDTFYEGVEQISPGSAFEIDARGQWTQWRYWSLDDLPKLEIRDPAGAFADLFEDAVRLRMRSDVPVGVCLSGGLDSTSILCAAARHRAHQQSQSDEPLLAFCYMAKEFDESKYIEDTLQRTSAQLQQLQTSPLELWNHLHRALWYQDEPVHTMTALVGFELMRLVAQSGIRVILNGQGADETIGGYSSYFFDAWLMQLRQGKWSCAWEAIKSYTSTHGGEPLQLFTSTVFRLLAWELYRVGPYQRFAQARYRRGVTRNAWFSQDFTRLLPRSEVPPLNATLDRALKQSVTSAPLPLYLRIEDRNAMAHSVEARLPFMDYRLVSLLFNLSPEWKIQGPWNKVVLREAMKDRIPESVRTRPDKMGFPTAGARWFAHDLYEPIRDLLGSRGVRERGIYDSQNILHDLERHRKGEIDVANRLFHIGEIEALAQLLRSDPLNGLSH